MKHPCCFVIIPEQLGDQYLKQRLLPGKYTMYYYGPSQANPGETIVESLKGILTTVPKEWVKLV